LFATTITSNADLLDWNKKGGQSIVHFSSLEGFCNPIAAKIASVLVSSMAPTSACHLRLMG
jgi:hypothetical protein